MPPIRLHPRNPEALGQSQQVSGGQVQGEYDGGDATHRGEASCLDLVHGAGRSVDEHDPNGVCPGGFGGPDVLGAGEPAHFDPGHGLPA